MKRSYIVACFIAGVMITLAACNGKHREPGHIYMPDMHYSQAFDAYSESPNFADHMSSRMPVKGTVKRGEMLPYHVPQSDSGYAFSGMVRNPLTVNDSMLAEGQRLFNIYCAVCHGEKLDGNGPLYKDGSGPFPVAPANFIAGPKASLPEGTIFYVATYGIRMMGSYASQLDRHQRWMVAAYIRSVQEKGGVTQTAVDSTQQSLVAAYRQTQNAFGGGSGQ
ncbi:cytochrome c [Compostibacter hankyongensis]|uniref:Cytochrome c n=1 Tax=Compostibacter hankyongensis TaxID=1007089 RepID=A0ABP8FDT1_9BACT